MWFTERVADPSQGVVGLRDGNHTQPEALLSSQDTLKKNQTHPSFVSLGGKKNIKISHKIKSNVHKKCKAEHGTLFKRQVTV